MSKKKTLADIRRKLEANKVSGVGNRDKLRKEFFEAYRREKKCTTA